MSTVADTSPLRRRMILWLALLVGLITPAVGFSLAAQAALPGHTAPGLFTKFEIDGDIAGVNDWAGGGYGPYTTAQGRPSAGIVALNELSDPCASSPDDFYTGSINGNPFPWPTDSGNVNNKNDICEYATALEIVDVDGEYHYVLYGYAARSGDATGDESLVFVLDKADTQIGDVIIQYDFDPSGTSVAQQATWDGSSWSLSILSEGVENAVGPNPFEPGANDETFVEFAVDLTSNGLFPPANANGVEQCVTFSSGGYATYTGNNLNAQLKDRAAGGGIPVSNCNDFIVEKDANVEAPGVNFLYTVNQLDGMTAHDDTLIPPAGESDLIGGYAGFGTTIQVGESHLWQNVTSEPDYQIDEALPDGWDLVDIECTWYDIFTNSTVTEVVTDGTGILDQFQIPPPDFDNGVTTTCVMTNETSGLVVEKIGEGDTDADFTFDVTGAPATPYTLQLDTATDFIAYDPDTTVTITETLPGGAPAWEYQGATCTSDGDTALDVTFAPGETVEVDTIGGEVITCVFENIQNGQIEVVKTGQPVGGGDSFGFDTNYADNTVAPDGSEDFALEIDDPANNSGDLAPGDYTIVELLDAANVNADPDYTLGDVSCVITTSGSDGSTSVTAMGDPTAVVTLAAGDIVTCTYTNVQAGRLIIEKETDGLDDTFTFNTDVTGDIMTTGGVTAEDDKLVADLPPADDYAVGEVVPAGWDLTGATCDNGSGVFADGAVEGGLSEISVGAGEIVTCTFTNEAIPSDVDVTKTVVGVADGFDWSFDFTISPTPDGQDATQTASGSGEASDTVSWTDLVPGDEYTITETGDPGYETGALTCTGVEDTDGNPADASVTFIAPLGGDGVEIDCAITNTANPSSVSVTKTVEGVDDTLDWSFDFTIDPAAGGEDATKTASGTGDGSDIVQWDSLVPGETYTIAETTVDGYTAGALSCIGVEDIDGDLTDASVTFVAPADGGSAVEFPEVQCSITNTAIPSDVEVTKTVAGVADGFDWSFDFTIAPVPTGETSPKTASGTGDGTASVAWADLVPGATYTIAEVAETGFETGVLTCSGVDDIDGADDESITFVAPLGGDGVDIVCAITNTANPSSVSVTKTVEGVDDTFDWSFDFTIDPAAGGEDATKTASGTGDGSDIVQWDSLVPGETYTIAETTVDGYTAGALSCIGVEDIDGDLTDASVTFVAPADGGSAVEFPEVQCSITNTAIPSDVEVTKTVAGVADGFDWSFDFTIAPVPTGETSPKTASGTGDGTASVAWADLVPGATYTIAEVAETGFETGVLTCSGVDDIDGADDESITFVAPLGWRRGRHRLCDHQHAIAVRGRGDQDGRGCR